MVRFMTTMVYVGVGFVQYHDPDGLARACEECFEVRKGPWEDTTLRVEPATREFDLWRMWIWEHDSRGRYQVGNLPRVCLYKEDAYHTFVEKEDSFWEREPVEWPDNEGRSASGCQRLVREAKRKITNSMVDANGRIRVKIPSNSHKWYEISSKADLKKLLTPGPVVAQPGPLAAN